MSKTDGRGSPMRSFVLALAAAALTAATAIPIDVEAQTGEKASRTRTKVRGSTSPAQAQPVGLDRVRGAKEAPAAVQAAGVACTITDAAYVGTLRDAAGATRLAYEVACREGLGHMVQLGQNGASSQAFDCLIVQTSARTAEAAGRPAGLQCRLPGNAQPATGLQPLVVSAGGTCTVNNARYIGSRSGGGALYEVSCAQGGGFVLERAAGGARPTLINCLSMAGTAAACTLTTPAQVIASLVPVVAQAQRQCTVGDARVAGRNPQSNNEIIEIGCSDGRPGFLLEVNATGQFVRALDCDRVSGVNCQFTNTAALQAANKQALLTRVRGASLGDCTPTDVRVLGSEVRTGRDVVEVSCSNRPYGAIAVLSSQTTPRNEAFDCLFAPRWGGQCQLTQASAAYPRISSGLRLRGANPNCSISNARWMGVTPQGENWFEIACQDGRSFLIDYRGAGQVASMLTCREGAGVGGGCRAGIGASVPRD